jgi:hypothetical protein
MEVHTVMAKVKRKFTIMVTEMLKLDLKMEQEKPRSRGDASQQVSLQPRSFVHIGSPTSHSGTGALSA